MTSTAAPTVDPLLELWGRAIEFLRLNVNADGDKLGDSDEPMTQEQLGEHLEPPVGQSTVSRWESGQREPRRRYKKQLADLFGVPQEWIFVPTVDGAKLPLPAAQARRGRVA